MARKKKQPWKIGDVFLVPLLDTGRFCIGQVIGQEPKAMNSVTISLPRL